MWQRGYQNQERWNLLQKPWYPAVNLKPVERRALKALKQSVDVVILSADKSKAIVVMYPKKYDEKLLSMLKDPTTYKKLSRDPAPPLECRMNSTLLSLHREGKLLKKCYAKLISSSCRNPLLYGLPKIHKQGVPLRPIVSFIHSPTYELSKYLSNLLSPLISVHEIISLLELYLNATFLNFRGVHYRQCFSTAMGSPVSVTIANLVMEEIEERALFTFDFRHMYYSASRHHIFFPPTSKPSQPTYTIYSGNSDR